MIAAQVKRFIEMWRADPSLRSALREDLSAAVVRYRLPVDPQKVRPLWDRDYEGCCRSPELRAYLDRVRKKREGRSRSKEASAPAHPAFRAWYDRQRRRCAREIYAPGREEPTHFPVCFELSTGCSVGCWFCALDAPPLTENLAYTPDNARLWRAVLEVVGEFCGPTARKGFCYGATEPFDNPDYEKFCADYHSVLGVYPATTTALPLTEPDRTRNLLRGSAARGCFENRFSILTLDMLRRVHREFNAAELADVELVLQNRGAYGTKSDAGRFREKRKRNPKLWEAERQKFRQWHAMDEADEVVSLLMSSVTVSCLSGFHFNMPERRVSLLGSCRPSERWPLGSIVFGEERFERPEDLGRIMVELLERNLEEGASADAEAPDAHDVQTMANLLRLLYPWL